MRIPHIPWVEAEQHRWHAVGLAPTSCFSQTDESVTEQRPDGTGLSKGQEMRSERSVALAYVSAQRVLN